MLRRSPLKRSGFKPKHEPSVPREDRPMALLTPSSRRGKYGGTTAGAVLEERPVRSEAYRRLVAQMPCMVCQRGPCQAAHPNTGKGMSMKTDDRLCFPLCPACHSRFDQSALLTKEDRRAIEPLWGAATRRQIQIEGRWPKSVPRWPADQLEATA